MNPRSTMGPLEEAQKTRVEKGKGLLCSLFLIFRSGGRLVGANLKEAKVKKGKRI